MKKSPTTPATHAQEVELGRIALRTDSSERHFHADVGMRADSLRLFFLCVHPAWLRLAMETVFGQTMPYREAAHHALTSGAATAAAVFCAGSATATGTSTATGASASGTSATGTTGTGSMRALLQRWLLARVWACSELETEFATQHTASGGASSRTTFRDGYWSALGRYSLKRCLQLWHCLELLKGARTLPADPPLFAVDAPFKSLADLAQEFAQRHLRGEANLARHLAHLGAPLKYVRVESEMAVGQ
jgi:hypothetical protein